MLSPSSDENWHGTVSRRSYRPNVCSPSPYPVSPSPTAELKWWRLRVIQSLDRHDCSDSWDLFSQDSEDEDPALASTPFCGISCVDTPVLLPAGRIEPPSPVAVQLDESTPHHQLLELLTHHATPDPVICVLYGPAGSGKRAVLDQLGGSIRSQLKLTATVCVQHAGQPLAHAIDQMAGPGTEFSGSGAVLRGLLHSQSIVRFVAAKPPQPPTVWKPAGCSYLLLEQPHHEWSQHWLPRPLPRGVRIVFSCDTALEVDRLEQMWRGEVCSWHQVDMPHQPQQAPPSSSIKMSQQHSTDQLQTALLAARLIKNGDASALFSRTVSALASSGIGAQALEAASKIGSPVSFELLVDHLLCELERSVGRAGAVKAVRALTAADIESSSTARIHPLLEPLRPVHRVAAALISRRYPVPALPTAHVHSRSEAVEYWSLQVEHLCGKDQLSHGTALCSLSRAHRALSGAQSSAAEEAVSVLSELSTGIPYIEALLELSLVQLAAGELQQSQSTAKQASQLVSELQLSWHPICGEVALALGVTLTRAGSAATEEFTRAREVLVRCYGVSSPLSVEARWRCGEALLCTADDSKRAEARCLCVALVEPSVSQCHAGAPVQPHITRWPAVQPTTAMYKKVLPSELNSLLMLEQAPAGVVFAVEAALVLMGQSSLWADFRLMTVEQLLGLLRSTETNLELISARQVAATRELLRGVTPEMLASKSPAGAALCSWAVSVAARWGKQHQVSEIMPECWLCLDIGNEHGIADPQSQCSTKLCDPRFELKHQANCFVQRHGDSAVESVEFTWGDWRCTATKDGTAFRASAVVYGDVGVLQAEVGLVGVSKRLVIKHSPLFCNKGGYTRYVFQKEV